jgi:hypothetical protein
MFENLARALKTLLTKAERVLDNPPYNLVIHTSSVQTQPTTTITGILKFMPKLTKTAGFEWGTGFLHQSHATGRSRKVFCEKPAVEEAATSSDGLAQADR